MEKYTVLAPAPAVGEVGGAARMMARHVGAALELGAVGLVVNLAHRGRGPREEQPTPAEEKAILGASEIWVPDGTAVDAGSFGGDWVYRLDWHRPKSRPREWARGAESPGVKTIFAVERTAARPEEFRHAWLEGHVPLALRHHVGMCAYETDVILAAPVGAPAFDGFSQLHFPSEEDFAERFYDDAAGRVEIEADVAGFVAAATAWEVAEHVLIDPPADP